MQRKLIAFTALLIFSSLLFVGCNPITTSETPTPGAALSEETAAPDVETATAEPIESTETTPSAAEDIPCTIAFQSDRDGNWELYSMAPDGSNPVNLTDNEADDAEPAFSPDGSQIAFVSNRAAGDEGGQFIYVMNADGSDVRKLTSEDGSNHPAWSPTGEAVVYDNGNDILIINADGNEPSRQLTDTPEKDTQPDFSPEDGFIIWLSGEDENTNILVMDLRSFEVQQITPDGGVTDALWTVDAEIFFHGASDLFGCFNCVMSADGTNVRDAGGKGTIQEFIPFWTLDGDRVECIGVNLGDLEDEEIFLVSDIYSEMFLNLTNDPGNDRNPTWPANCGLSYEAAENDDSQTESSTGEVVFILGYEDADEVMTSNQKADLEQACSELPIVCVQDDFDALIEQGVDAIISFSSRWHVLGSAPQIYNAVGNDIPVIVLNAESDTDGTYNLSTDSEYIQSSLSWMFKEMGETGEFVYFVCGENSIHQSIIDSVLEDHPGISAISMPADFEDNRITWEDIAELIAENPNLGAIWSDENVPELLIAANGILEGQPPYIVCEATEDRLVLWQETIETNPLFKCYSAIHPGGTAYEGIYVAYYLLSGYEINQDALGGPFGNTFLYDFPVITNENLDEWLGRLDKFRMSKWGTYELSPMTPDEILDNWFTE